MHSSKPRGFPQSQVPKFALLSLGASARRHFERSLPVHQHHAFPKTEAPGMNDSSDVRKKIHFTDLTGRVESVCAVRAVWRCFRPNAWLWEKSLHACTELRSRDVLQLSRTNRQAYGSRPDSAEARFAIGESSRLPVMCHVPHFASLTSEIAPLRGPRRDGGGLRGRTFTRRMSTTPDRLCHQA